MLNIVMIFQMILYWTNNDSRVLNLLTSLPLWLWKLEGKSGVLGYEKQETDMQPVFARHNTLQVVPRWWTHRHGNDSATTKGGKLVSDIKLVVLFRLIGDLTIFTANFDDQSQFLIIQFFIWLFAYD